VSRFFLVWHPRVPGIRVEKRREVFLGHDRTRVINDWPHDRMPDAIGSDVTEGDAAGIRPSDLRHSHRKHEVAKRSDYVFVGAHDAMRGLESCVDRWRVGNTHGNFRAIESPAVNT
jgi:hypothetical protein